MASCVAPVTPSKTEIGLEAGPKCDSWIDCPEKYIHLSMGWGTWAVTIFCQWLSTVADHTHAETGGMAVERRELLEFRVIRPSWGAIAMSCSGCGKSAPSSLTRR